MSRERHPAFEVAWRTVQPVDRPGDGLRRRAVARRLGEPPLEFFGAGIGLADRLEVLQQRKAIDQRAKPIVRRRVRRVENARVVARIDREAMVMVPGAEAAFFGIETQHDLAFAEDLAVLVAEHRDQNLAPEPAAIGVEVDVEERRVRRILAPFEHVEPPEVVLAADAHVVWHDVEDDADAAFVQRRDERIEIGRGSEFRV